MPEIRVHTPFTLTLDINQREHFPVGVHRVSEAVASHWYTKLHTKDDDQEQPAEADAATDDLRSKVDELIADLAKATEEMAAAVAQRDEALARVDELEAILEHATEPEASSEPPAAGEQKDEAKAEGASTEADEKAALLAKAAELGVQVDKRWGIDRLRAAIEAGQKA
ncbi:chromosome segregation ATPase [Chelatococcus caeni]|uniref:Chromosome segregation ATPase n=1 Tax=Chelatococcus caeni TaxID=1348468 RepID=A0A840C374_9HYPH|nr:hypothetical protein [Chelatococcus caeni]MBB4017376.1 chromosome segregation ATPase [Chelatococcus caeni]